MSCRAWLALPALAPLLLSTSCLLNPIGEDPGYEQSTSGDSPVGPELGAVSPTGAAPGNPASGIPVPGPDDGEIVCGGPINAPSPAASGPVAPSAPSPVTPVATGVTPPTPTPAPTTTSTAVPDAPPPDDVLPVDMPSDGGAGPDAGAEPLSAANPVLLMDAGAELAEPQDAGAEDRWRWRR